MQQDILCQTIEVKVEEDTTAKSMQGEQAGEDAVGEARSPFRSADGEVSSIKAEEGVGKSNEREREKEYPKSEYRGVCWNKKNNRWQAAINIQSSYLYLGSYKFEEEIKAAEAFDVAAFMIRGRDKSKLNFPEKIDAILNSKDPNLDSAKQKVKSFLSNRQDMKEIKKKEEDGVLRREFLVGDDEVSSSDRDALSARYVSIYSQRLDPSDQQFLMDIHNRPDRHEDEDYRITIQERNSFSAADYVEMRWCYPYFTDNNTYQFQKAYRVFSMDEVVFEGMLLIDCRLNQFAAAIFDPDLKHPGFFHLPRSNFQRACVFIRRVLYKISILKLQHVDQLRREYFHNQPAAGYNNNNEYLDSSLYQEIQQAQRHQQQQILDYQQQQQLHQQQQDQYLLQQQPEYFQGHRQMFYEQQHRSYPTDTRGMQYQGAVLRTGGAQLSDEQLAYAARGFSESGGFDAQFMEAVVSQGRRGGGYGQQYPAYSGYDNQTGGQQYIIPSSPMPMGCGQQHQQMQQVLDFQEIAQTYGFAAAAQNPRNCNDYGVGAPKTPPVYKEEQPCKEELVGTFTKGISIGEDMLTSLEIPDSSEVARLQAGASGLPKDIFGSIALGTGGGDNKGEQKAEEPNKQQMEKLSADLNKILTTSRSQNMSFDLNYPPADCDSRERDMSIELMQTNYTYDDVNRMLASDNR